MPQSCGAWWRAAARSQLPRWQEPPWASAPCPQAPCRLRARAPQGPGPARPGLSGSSPSLGREWPASASVGRAGSTAEVGLEDKSTGYEWTHRPGLGAIQGHCSVGLRSVGPRAIEMGRGHASCAIRNHTAGPLRPIQNLPCRGPGLGAPEPPQAQGVHA